jgi:hypothetical protein
MSSSPGYKIKVKLGGTPTVFNQSNASKIGATNSFRIDDVMMRVISTENPLVIETSDGLTVLGSGLINAIDYLNGIITLDNAVVLPVGFEDDIFITGEYIPLTDIGGGMECSLDIGGDVLTNTDFSNVGYVTRGYGLHDVSATIGRYDPLDLVFRTHKRNREIVFLEFRFGNGVEVCKGWFVVESESLSGDVGGLEKEDLQFNLSGEAEQAFAVRIEL